MLRDYKEKEFELYKTIFVIVTSIVVSIIGYTFVSFEKLSNIKLVIINVITFFSLIVATSVFFRLKKILLELKDIE